jgi:hypothetical protein
MPPQFEWYEDERQATIEKTGHSSAPGPGRWLRLIIMLFLAGAVGTFVYLRLNQRVDLAIAAVEQDVLASYRLVEQAAANQDADLLRTVLSGKDKHWLAAQLEHVSDGTLFDLQLFDLRAEQAEVGAPKVSLSPDLDAAEVQVQRTYLSHVESIEQTLHLNQTMIFRRGTDRWLFAPPEETFWGGQVQIEEQGVTIQFPERDEEFAARLATFLSSKLEGLCEELVGLDCQDNLKIELILDPNPDTLIQMQTNTAEFLTSKQVVLPAPSLIGVPVDDFSYQVMLKGYSVPVIGLAISNQIGWRCCDQLLVQAAFVDSLLIRLGHKNSGLSPSDYETLLTNLDHIDGISILWSNDEDSIQDPIKWRMAQALITFALHVTPPLSVTELQHSLTSSRTYLDS